MNGTKHRLAWGKAIGLSEAWQLICMEMKSIKILLFGRAFTQLKILLCVVSVFNAQS